jgi:tetratricopeptide (TPR) repeat protein
MQFFDGLYQYEIVMLLCGVLFFLVLLAAIIVYLVRGKALTGLLVAFVIPVVMIGFPGINTISLSKDKLELQTKIKEVQNAPNDQKAREELDKVTARIESRQISNPETLTDLAKAQFILDEQDKAKINLDKALNTDPNLPAARDLEKKIKLINDVEKLTNEVTAKPTNEAVKTELTKKVAEVEQLPIASSDALVTVGRAQEVIGKTADAKKTADTAVAIDPKSVKATELQHRVNSKQLQTVAPK